MSHSNESSTAEMLRSLGSHYGKKLDAESCALLFRAADELSASESRLSAVQNQLAEWKRSAKYQKWLARCRKKKAQKMHEQLKTLGTIYEGMRDAYTGNLQLLAETQDELEALKRQQDELGDKAAALLNEVVESRAVEGTGPVQESRLSINNERLAKRDATYFYNQGYQAGHNDTAEGCFTDVHPDDSDSYHDDIVAELMQDRFDEGQEP